MLNCCPLTVRFCILLCELTIMINQKWTYTCCILYIYELKRSPVTFLWEWVCTLCVHCDVTQCASLLYTTTLSHIVDEHRVQSERACAVWLLVFLSLLLDHLIRRITLLSFAWWHIVCKLWFLFSVALNPSMLDTECSMVGIESNVDWV